MVATRSSTRKLPPKRAATPDSDSEASETEQQARPKKRVRVHRGNQGADDDQGGKTPAVAVKSHNRRRKLGRLAMMMSMPIDVFCEIALYLGPHDLLSMARTSKALRNLLMTKDSKPIWRAAEDSVGLPECPLDLSSPQYASFIYDTYCTHCFRTKGYNHLTPLRIRLCKTCMKKNFQTTDSRMYKCLDMPSIDKELSCVLLLVNGISVCFPEFTDEERIKSLYGWQLRTFKYYFPQVKAALEKFRSFRRAYKQRERYVDACHEATCQKYLSSPALDRWLENTKEAKINDIQIAKDRRARSIFIKLAELGYTEDDYQTQRDEKHWEWNSLIDQTRPLTDRIWKNIRPQLEETIRLRRELRTRLERERCIEERQRKLAGIAKSFADSEEGKMCCIIHSDILKLPIAKQILDSDEPGSDIPQVHQTPLKQQMVEMSKGRHLKFEEEGSSKVLSTRHAAGLKAFKSTTRNSLEDRPGKARNDAGGNEDILQHPTTVFWRRPFGEARLAPFSELLKDLRNYCWHRNFAPVDRYGDTPFRWTLNPPSCNGILIAEALYSAVALPNKSMSDMLALGKSFVCLRCDPITREVMSWICLVNHFYNECIQFEERENLKKRRNDCVIANIEDHDREKSRSLAAYIGNLQAGVTSADSPEVPNSLELEKWIKPCTCETHTSDIYHSKVCPECQTLGMRYRTYPCLGKLDAHRRAIHAHGQEL